VSGVRCRGVACRGYLQPFPPRGVGSTRGGLSRAEHAVPGAVGSCEHAQRLVAVGTGSSGCRPPAVTASYPRGTPRSAPTWSDGVGDLAAWCSSLASRNPMGDPSMPASAEVQSMPAKVNATGDETPRPAHTGASPPESGSGVAALTLINRPRASRGRPPDRDEWDLSRCSGTRAIMPCHSVCSSAMRRRVVCSLSAPDAATPTPLTPPTLRPWLSVHGAWRQSVMTCSWSQIVWPRW
jgi:hypothetical protein